MSLNPIIPSSSNIPPTHTKTTKKTARREGGSEIKTTRAAQTLKNHEPASARVEGKKTSRMKTSASARQLSRVSKSQKREEKVAKQNAAFIKKHEKKKDYLKEEEPTLTEKYHLKKERLKQYVNRNLNPKYKGV